MNGHPVTSEQAQSSPTILRIDRVSKSFSGVQVLKEVSFDLRAGEVHCLVGQNGAGKSTLIKILSGVHRRDSGQIEIKGEAVDFGSPAEGLKKGISVIYQEIDLIPDLTVAENITLGIEKARCGIFRRISDERELALHTLSLMNEPISPDDVVRSLPLAQQQMVAIAKSLAVKVDIIVMDEPTSALSSKEIRTLFRIIGDLKSRGIGIVYISHRIEEIFEIGDRVTVLKDGERVETARCGDIDTSQLIHAMVGKEFGRLFPVRPKAGGEEKLLEVRNLTSLGAFEDVSFDLYKGEIFGIAGFVGSGRSEIARALFGRDPADSGQILFKGAPVDIRSPKQAIGHRIGMIPEDRKLQALQLEAPMFENITFNSLNRLKKWGWINRGGQIDLSLERIRAIEIQPEQPHKIVNELSGGTQQKVVLANWMFEGMELIIMDEPTRGIDVGTKAEIFRFIRRWADNGVGIILISSEFPELLGMCDRILVLREGRTVSILDGEHADEKTILELIFRGKNENRSDAVD